MRATVLALVVMAAMTGPLFADTSIQLGPRPFFLVDQMRDGDLKDRLQACEAGPFRRTDFSIAHRGAPLQFPEHTRESYLAAWRMGAGIIECDATFTRDRELVCRHAQCDLHMTTDILLNPDLAAKCSQPFVPASSETGRRAEARCCASDITLAEFRRLRGKMEGVDRDATTVEDYVRGTAPWRTELYAAGATLMSHADSIALFRELGVKMTPELKSPQVAMPFEGEFSQADYAEKLIEEYRAAGVDPADVFVQSFDLDDVLHWIEHHPEFGRQAIWLDSRSPRAGFDPERPESWTPSMDDLAAMGVRYLGPPLWMLVRAGPEGRPEPSRYAREAAAAGIGLIAWTVERSGPLADGGGWYFQTTNEITRREGDVYEQLEALREAGVVGVFSDWPATTTYFASCVGLD